MNGPDDPVLAIDELAGSLHELFLALLRCGFTEWQSCQVVAVLLTQGAR